MHGIMSTGLLAHVEGGGGCAVQLLSIPVVYVHGKVLCGIELSAFYNLGHYVLDVQTCGTYLLGYETGGRHARRGVKTKKFSLCYLFS